MSLVKILILSNVLDPFVSLEAVYDAYRTVDEIERDLLARSVSARRHCRSVRL